MDSPHRGISARRRFWVAIFALVSLVVLAGGLAYYRYEQDHIRREKYEELAAIADLKVRQILEWRRERLGDAGTVVRSPFLRQAIADWLQDPGKPGLRLALLEHFKIVKESYGYGNVLLVAPDGRTLLSVRPDPAPLSPAGKQALEAAVAGRQAVLSDLFRCPQDNQVHLDVAAPVLNSQGHPLAVVVLRTNADEVLYPLIQSWPTPSRTAETLMVEVEGKDVLFLNNLRHREKPPLSLREPLTQTELPAVQAVLGKRGMFHGTDYRDVEVLADLRPVPQSPWFMVAKVDADEILAEARYRSGITAFVVFIFILLAAAVTAYGYRQRHVGILQDLYRTERERRQAQEEFRTTLYSIGDAVITTDTEGRVKQMNQVAERLTGWLEAEARDRPLEEVFHILNEETRSPVDNPAERVLREGRVVGLANHTLLIARDGTERSIADSGAPIRNENGAVMGVVLVFRDQTQEQETQKALRKSEERLRAVLDSTPFPIAIVDLLDDNIHSWSRSALTIFGHTAPTTSEWYQIAYPDPNYRREVIDRWKPFLEIARECRQNVNTGEYRVTCSDGSERICELYATFLPDILIVTFNDITERKQAEQAQSDSEAQHRAILQTAMDGFWMVDTQGRLLEVNETYCRMSGYNAPELLAMRISYLDASETADDTAAHIQKIMAQGEDRFESQHRRKDGSIFDVEVSVQYRSTEGGLMVAFLRDITERKQAEEALQESEAQYRLLAENVIDVIWTMDLNWKFTYASPSCESLSGYKDKEIVGMTLDQLLTPGSTDLCKKTIAELLSPENLARQKNPHFILPQLELRSKGGDRTVYIEVNGSFLMDSQGQPVGMVGVARDITDRKQMEEQFFQAQKMEAVGTLAGGIAHDFNNILTAILGNIGLAALDPKIGPRVQDRLAQADAACWRAQALSQQLLTFAKGGTPVKKLFSVVELLTESTAFSCVGSPVKCETTFPENLWLIEADPGQIGQVFQNITINAIQAMPTGGTIKVWTENLTLGTDSGLPLSAGRYIKISVRDQGTGIPAEHLPRIFDPYFTTKHKGSGLGLASTYAIIEKHHGHIAVESKPGAGTTFDIYLPAVDQQSTPQPAEDRALLVGTGKILVMDDEEMVREVLGRLLARLGYEAKFARDGGEAVEMFAQAHGSGQAFAAVMLDLTVPGGMGGKEAMAKLLEIDPQVKAVVSSGYSDDPIMADFQKYGFSNVIAKPYRISELGKILHEVAMGKP